MTPLIRVGVAVAVSMQLSVATLHPQDETRAPLANARFDHMAIATRDADRTATQLAALLGIDPPTSRIVTVDGPGGRPVRLKTAVLNTADFRIDVNQPIGGPSSTQQFVQRFGVGIEYIGFAVDDPIADRIRDMERSGGTVTLGKASGQRAIVAFPDIGLSIDIARDVRAASAGSPALRPGALGSRKVSHVGFVYRNARPALDVLARLLGAPPPALTVFTPIDYLPGAAADPSAHVKFAMFRTSGVSLEIIEPVGGPSPWMDFVDARRDGAAAHHIAFAFGARDDDFDAIARDLQTRGGRWNKGRRGFEGAKSGSSPEFEFLDTLGLVIEVTKAGN